ncbi:MAG: 3-hydroxyisobutyrate dehydrogenase [Rhodospirillaceae bacterium]|jgi:3-hydroxyisobutyrate dehydrogenase-like beta-hydroxyacid dehydrogenase|nr:3-hydroxyisobutyrate dehydrogenase [Rhodospirillaceae bacterium]|tara:strand:- start:254 stop:1135 length:882 start_codon:yes stop_codon:yes gene_type:complete
MKKIGWIGLGKMGEPMAKKIVQAGYSLTVYNRSAGKADELKSEGAFVANDIKSVAENSDFIISMISDDAALNTVAMGPDGVLQNAKPGSTFIDMSTVSPVASAAIAETAAAARISYLRAPVNGTVMQAEASTLVILISGPKESFDACEEIFRKMGDKIFYTGPDEQARYLKLCINMMVGISSAMMGEALVLGESGGLDWEQMIEIIKNSAVGSPVIHYKEKTLKERNFTPAFTVRQLAKDFDLMLDTGRQSEIPMPITSHVRQNLSTMIATGRGDQDFFAYVEMLEELAGMKK